MPNPPGEADLRDLALRFQRAEGQVLGGLSGAATGDRPAATRRALEALAALRALDLRAPVVTAYLTEHPEGRPDAVRDLAGSLAHRLDTGAQTAADGVRDTYRKVTPDNIAEITAEATLAHVDQRGTRWALGAWAEMNTTTIGRQATSRGLTDRVGEGGRVIVEVSGCSYCAEYEGEAIIGQDPLPPFHPNCTCVASAA